MARRPSHYIDIRHDGLGTFQRIQGSDPYVVEERARTKLREWELRWQKQQEVATKRSARQRDKAARAREKQDKERRKAEAAEQTAEAEAAIAALEGILAHTLGVDDRVDFTSLLSSERFAEVPPVAPRPSTRPEPSAPSFRMYEPVPPSFWQKVVEIFSSASKQRRLSEEQTAEAAIRAEDDAANEARHRDWQAVIARLEWEDGRAMADHRAALLEQAERRLKFEETQRDHNERVTALERGYQAREPGAIEEHAELVLSASTYPECFPQTFVLEYRADARMLVVDYRLPAPEDLPSTKAVKYVAAHDELEEVPLPEPAAAKLFDSVVQQTALRTVHELFEADVVDAFDAIAWNGIVESIDRSTGKPISPCILSLQVNKQEFLTFNLAAIEPKACIRKLKGVGSAQLHQLAAVAPIVKLDTADARFVDAREVIDGVHEGTNLGAMDWEEFEHLIRQVFEREFASSGGEVKVTRASRDGGVDAVIFDPDPIRGGKYVLQAKRYTAVVPVSAVRDLYGTMMNEGAAKGILVTTATYGADSYTFAKDKPITLIDGSNLLHILQRHGTRAHIDLKAARAAEKSG